MYLVCGELLFDVFSPAEQPEQSNRINFQAVAGGSPYNVAIGLQRLGAESAMLAGISTDFLGQRLERILTEEGVSLDYLVHHDLPTTLAMVSLDAHGSPSYSFRGNGCADRELRLEHLPTLPERIKGIHVGSYSLVVSPIADTLLELVRRESAQRLISLDPNVRLNVEPDIRVWRDRVAALAEHAHVIKVSEEDLQALYPEQTPEAVIGTWLNARCTLVLLTLGSQGAQVFSRQHGSWKVPARQVVTKDTVGAGDTFQAALLAWLSEHRFATPQALQDLSVDDINRLLNFAVAAAAITCGRVGPDLPYRYQIDGQD